MEYLGRRRNLSLAAQLQYEFLDIPQYADFTPYGESRQYFFKLGAEIGYSYNRSQMLGLGFRYEQLRFNPSLISLFAVKGKSNLLAGSMFYRLNTLNRNVYPSKGWKLDIQGDWITSQDESLTFFIEGKPILNTDSLNLSRDPYGRTMLLAENYQRLGSRGTLLAMAQAGINFRYGQFFVNDFMVGGMTRQFRNQVVFAGYSENEIFSNSVASLQLGYQHEIFDKLYLAWRSNIMAYDFVARKDAEAVGRFLSGHALTASYLTAIGPIEFSAMYGDQSRKLQAYVNIGLSF